MSFIANLGQTISNDLFNDNFIYGSTDKFDDVFNIDSALNNVKHAYDVWPQEHLDLFG
jgi:hypothetical protein